MSSKPDTNAENLTKAIDKLLTDIYEGDPDSQTMINQVDFVEKLYKCKETAAKAKSTERPFSIDVVANVVASVAGIAMIVNYEKAAVLTSKAISFVRKLT